jgi:hypothetical protein
LSEGIAEWVPLPTRGRLGKVDSCWIDVGEAGLLLEAGQLDQAEAVLERDREWGRAGDDPMDAAWLWAIRLRLAERGAWTRSVPSWPATRRSIPGGLELPARRAHLRRPGRGHAGRPARGRGALAAGRRRGRRRRRRRPRAHARSADGTWRRPSWRPRATRRPPWRSTSRCSTAPSCTGPPTCWPTATRAPPAACSPSATAGGLSTTPPRRPGCWTAGPADAATPPPPSSAASATPPPSPTTPPPHPPRTRGRHPPRRGPLQRRDRPPPLHLHQDRLGPRLQHPRQARHDLPHRGRHLGRPLRPGPARLTAP